MIIHHLWLSSCVCVITDCSSLFISNTTATKRVSSSPLVFRASLRRIGMTLRASSRVLGVSFATAAIVGIVLVAFRSRKKREQEDDRKPSNVHVFAIPGDPALPTHLRRELYKEERRQKMAPLLAMKKPMYDNILMKDPDGDILSSISMKKANWYVRKELATWEDDEHSVIRLTFEPKKKSLQQLEENEYNQSLKQNHCVACGNDKDYRRHYVVPHCYRSRFPRRFKNHLSHDVVILCPVCHVRAQQISHEHKDDLEDQLRRKYFQHSIEQMELSAQPVLVDFPIYQARSAACALLKWKDGLPATKQQEYENLLRDHFKLDENRELSEAQLVQASRFESRRPNPSFVTGPELVGRHLREQQQTTTTEVVITAFVKEWRALFVESMNPKFLPKGWNVDAPAKC